MIINKIERLGVVVELDGDYWGVQYQDGHITERGYGPIENAQIVNPDHTEGKTTSLTWTPKDGMYNPDYEELKKGKFVDIKKTTIYEA